MRQRLGAHDGVEGGNSIGKLTAHLSRIAEINRACERIQLSTDFLGTTVQPGAQQHDHDKGHTEKRYPSHQVHGMTNP